MPRIPFTLSDKGAPRKAWIEAVGTMKHKNVFHTSSFVIVLSNGMKGRGQVGHRHHLWGAYPHLTRIYA